jgi:hypothetical protein
LTDPAPLHAEAVVTGDVLTITRRSSTATAFIALNVSSTDAVLAADVSARCWSRMLDSGDPDLGGQGQRSPIELGAAEQLALGPYGFCLYIATETEGNA